MSIESRHSRADKAAATVREKGARAFRDGISEHACPYQDLRKIDGRLTFARHWVNTWLAGWRNERDKNKAGSAPQDAEQKDPTPGGELPNIPGFQSTSGADK
jgi:ribosome modulation factor